MPDVIGICQDLKTGERIKERLSYIDDPDHPSGAVKDVYLSHDGSYVVAFYKDEKTNAKRKCRLEKLVFRSRQSIFGPKPAGDYWKDVFCWPTHIIEDGDRIGIAVPAYRNNFRFSFAGMPGFPKKGTEKTATWFFNPDQRFGLLDKREIGDWRRCFDCALVLARGIRRLHFEGLVHSDLSPKNVLIDPSDRPNAGNAAPTIAIIDLDGLVITDDDVATPDVEGTSGYQAPEIVQSPNAPVNTRAELHSLAVLIYQYLLCRHPLDGKLVCDKNPAKDEMLRYGEKALFIEDPNDKRNRYDWKYVESTTRKKRTLPFLKPWMDLDALPYTVLGPYLSPLVTQAFVEALHDPSKLRPSAAEWELALSRTLDLLVPCPNPDCLMKWFIPGVNPGGKCPFCGTKEPKISPCVTLHDKSRRGNGFDFKKPRQINLYHRLNHVPYLYLWHVRSSRLQQNRESLSTNDLRPFGAFALKGKNWFFYSLRNGASIPMESGIESPIAVNQPVPLRDGMKILLRERPSSNCEPVLAVAHLS